MTAGARATAKGAGAGAAPLSADEIASRYRASGYDLASHPGHVIRRAHQRATACFQAIMAGHDLTPLQMAVLATLLREGTLSQNQLGRLTAMDPSTVSLVVRNLLKANLLERSGSASDQRLAILRLTDEGVRYTLSILPAGIAVSRAILAPLSEPEQKLFMDLLYRIADAGPPAPG